jgi:hypothetical protein
MVSLDIGIWTAAILIIMGYSFIIKDNPLFRFAEATMIGTSAGVLAVQGLENIKRLSWTPLVVKAEYINLIPILIGLLIFFRLSRRYSYLSRIPVSFLIGSGIGVSITTSIAAEIIGQIRGLFTPMPTSAFEIFNTIFIPASLIGVLLFFTYTKEQTGTLGIITKFGRYVLMFGLGANFGNMIMTRATYVIINLQKIIYDWLGILI